jgi:hypothetical protein
MQLRQTADQLIPELAQHQRRFLLVGATAAAVSLVGWFLQAPQFYQSYLTAYMLVLGATNGCLAFAMIHQLTGGAWGVVTRRIIGAATRVLPVLTLLFLPIALGMTHLYEWTHTDVVAADTVLSHKSAYLSVPFFLLRAAVYFAVWNGLSYFLNAWSLEQDRTGDPALSRRMYRVSGAGLVAYGVTTTFASIDWMMSLDPHWYSTIYGVLIMGGQGLTAIAVIIIALAWLSAREPLNTIVVPQHFHDLANLLLAFVMLWAYFSFSQYLIIYSANLPEEITWYMSRLQTSWRAVGLFLVVFHFAVPFMILLFRSLKRAPRVLVKVALGVILVRAVDLFWLVAPHFHKEQLTVTWLDVVLLLALSSIWIGCFLWQLRGRAILPLYDPQFREVIGLPVESAGGIRNTS